MNDYVRLPSQQFNNLVKRYIQHRKANELEGESSLNWELLQCPFFRCRRSYSERNIWHRSKKCDGKDEFLSRTSMSKSMQGLPGEIGSSLFAHLAIWTDQWTYHQYSSASDDVSANTDWEIRSSGTWEQSISYSSSLLLPRTVSYLRTYFPLQIRTESVGFSSYV